MRTYEIREGNGNDGEYRRGFIDAVDSFEALRKASRRRMIWKPKSVTLSSMDGDDEQSYLVDYSNPIFGDACRWCASASLVR